MKKAMNWYVKPTIPSIGQSDGLYGAEEQMNKWIYKVADELAQIMKYPQRSERGFWQKTVPEALASILSGWDRRASKLAAIAYLEKEWGCTVVDYDASRDNPENQDVAKLLQECVTMRSQTHHGVDECLLKLNQILERIQRDPAED